MSQVAQLYHPSQYKKKLCVASDCEYSIYCSFAHSEDELKLKKLHLLERSHDFFIFDYKTVECPFMQQHDRKNCVYFHNPQDQRRRGGYSKEECKKWSKYQKVLSYEDSGCHIDCEKSHGWKERDFHLQIYKVRKCKGGCQKQAHCPFWHDQLDRRKAPTAAQTARWNAVQIDPSPFKNT